MQINNLKSSAIGLFCSNLLSFLIICVSYFVYSSKLTPEEFGLYSIGISISIFGNLVLDGGIKTSIIKSKIEFNKKEEGALLFVMVIISFTMVIITLLTQQINTIISFVSVDDFRFILIFSSIYWFSYPWMIIPTAFLERKFKYREVAIAEFISVLLERALPSVFLLLNFGMDSFLWSVLIGRFTRVLIFNVYYNSFFYLPSLQEIKSILYLFKEGFWIQLATCSSVFRDNLHVILVGLLFGKTWLGYYSWILQLCYSIMQIFSFAASRISVSLFSRCTDSERWSICLYQLKILTIFSAPILIILNIIVPLLNEEYFFAKWTGSLAILPFVVLRTIPGTSSSIIAAFLTIQREGKIFAKAMLLWAIIEFTCALIFMIKFGPIGLSWSYVLTMIIGMIILVCFSFAKPIKYIFDMLNCILIRPSIAVSTLLTILHILIVSKLSISFIENILIGVFIVVMSYLSEPKCRDILKLFYRQLKLSNS